MVSATPTVLVVDDSRLNRDLLSRRLNREGLCIVAAADGREAMEVLEHRKIDLVLLDIMMPELDGYQVLGNIKSNAVLAGIPVIMITSLDEVDSAVRCIELGADDYLTKPFNPVLLKARVGACLERKRLHDQELRHRQALESSNIYLQEQVSDQTEQIASAQLSTIFAMSKLAESKDSETGAHLERMREYCKVIGEHLAKQQEYRTLIDDEFILATYCASPLHDIGKVAIPDDILLKNGELSPDEWQVMKTHTVTGAEILRAVDRQHPGNTFIQLGIEIAESHHEKWDGNGYPYGLSGERIPLSARILSLADVYDALTSERCYKKAFSHQTSRAMIVERRGTDFAPDIVDAFVETEQEFIRIRTFFKDDEAVRTSKAS